MAIDFEKTPDPDVTEITIRIPGKFMPYVRDWKQRLTAGEDPAPPLRRFIRRHVIREALRCVAQEAMITNRKTTEQTLTVDETDAGNRLATLQNDPEVTE
jgi:hypothetical protein